MERGRDEDEEEQEEIREEQDTEESELVTLEDLRGMYDSEQEISETAEQLDLGEQVATDMDVLWQKSVQDLDDGEVKEYAATLVKGQGGELKLVNPVEGNHSSVIPNLDIAEDEELVGTFHTHPYEDGTTAAFSGQDIASALEAQERISLVRSGDETYALVRTESTPDAVDADEIRETFEQEVCKYLDNPSVSFSEAVYRANIEMCRRYGLAFYRGTGGKLTEVYRP